MGLADKNGPLGETVTVKFYGGGPNDGLIIAWPENKLPERLFLVEVIPELVGLEKEVKGEVQRKRWGYYEPRSVSGLIDTRSHRYHAHWSGWHDTWELIDDGF